MLIFYQKIVLKSLIVHTLKVRISSVFMMNFLSFFGCIVHACVYLQNDIIKKALRDSKKVCVIASEEEDSPVWLNNDGPYVVVFDPLDGSRNIDASIPTGSIFGIYRRLEGTDAFPEKEKAELNVLQRGELLVAAVYTLYSSATILCLSLGAGTHAFTFDHSTGDFILTNPNLTIPERGTNNSLSQYQCLGKKHQIYPKNRNSLFSTRLIIQRKKPWILKVAFLKLLKQLQVSVPIQVSTTGCASNLMVMLKKHEV